MTSATIAEFPVNSNNDNDNDNNNNNNTNDSPIQMALNPISSLFTSLFTSSRPRNSLPSKSCAHQLLLYRQLLLQKVHPDLCLSRPYTGAPSQLAVEHLSYWQKVDEGKGKGRERLSVSYEDLINRIWVSEHSSSQSSSHSSSQSSSHSPPPPPLSIPDPFWVDVIGFQLPNPLTDFRAGGLLSLCLLHHTLTTAPTLRHRFSHPGKVGSPSSGTTTTTKTKTKTTPFPFALTSINVTAMLCAELNLREESSLLLVSKKKRYYGMFEASSSALFDVQTVCVGLVADVGERVFGGEIDVFKFGQVLEIVREIVGEVLEQGVGEVAEFEVNCLKVLHKINEREMKKTKTKTKK